MLVGQFWVLSGGVASPSLSYQDFVTPVPFVFHPACLLLVSHIPLPTFVFLRCVTFFGVILSIVHLYMFWVGLFLSPLLLSPASLTPLPIFVRCDFSSDLCSLALSCLFVDCGLFPTVCHSLTCLLMEDLFRCTPDHKVFSKLEMERRSLWVVGGTGFCHLLLMLRMMIALLPNAVLEDSGGGGQREFQFAMES